MMRAFECKKCGQCCFGEGGICLEQEEIPRIAEFLGVDEAAFLRRFCRGKNGRISIRTGSDGYCLFFDRERQCTIHRVKPRICSLWPFYPALLKDRQAWESAKDACPGINPEADFESFVKEAEE